MTRAKRTLSMFGLVLASVGITGCSGINYTHGVSPATFLLPGLVENQEPMTGHDVPKEETTYVQVTQNF